MAKNQRSIEAIRIKWIFHRNWGRTAAVPSPLFQEGCIPLQSKGRRTRELRPIRLWRAGCSTWKILGSLATHISGKLQTGEGRQGGREGKKRGSRGGGAWEFCSFYSLHTPTSKKNVNIPNILILNSTLRYPSRRKSENTKKHQLNPLGPHPRKMNIWPNSDPSARLKGDFSSLFSSRGVGWVGI